MLLSCLASLCTRRLGTFIRTEVLGVPTGPHDTHVDALSVLLVQYLSFHTHTLEIYAYLEV